MSYIGGGSGGGSSGITINSTSITGGTNQRVLFDNSGVVGETAGITTDGTNVTAFSLLDASAAFGVTVAANSSVALTSGRTLTLDMGNVAHTLAFGTTANTITFPNASSYTVAGLSVLNVFTVKQTITAGTLGDQAQAFTVTATQPTTPTGQQSAMTFSITSAGTASQANNVFRVDYNAGYTGSSETRGALFVNGVAGTGSTLIASAGTNNPTANEGFLAVANGVTIGTNIGVSGGGSNGNVNVGVHGTAQLGKNSSTNIAVVGSAINTGTSSVQIGGFFSLNQITVPTVSAALLADNGVQSDSIALFRSNSSTQWEINGAGALVGTPRTPADQKQAFSVTATQPTTITAQQSAILFSITSVGSSSQNNNAFRIDYLAGYTGSAETRSALFVNQVAGTGNVFVAAAGTNNPTGNEGFLAATTGSTTGYNFGCVGGAAFGTLNVGVYGQAQFAKNSATNIGVAGSAINTGTSPIHIGGFFCLNQTTVPTVSAALIADNGSQTNPVALFRVNNSTFWSVTSAGSLAGIAAATNATDGFIYIPGGSGTPVGTPTAQTGTYPLYWDHTNKKLYIYDGSWLGGTAPGVWT